MKELMIFKRMAGKATILKGLDLGKTRFKPKIFITDGIGGERIGFAKIFEEKYKENGKFKKKVVGHFTITDRGFAKRLKKAFKTGEYSIGGIDKEFMKEFGKFKRVK